MKIQLMTVLAFALAVLVSCTETTTTETTTTEAEEGPDYAAFDAKADLIRTFFQAHSDEDVEALEGMVAEDFEWSAPNNSGSEHAGKEEFLAAMAAYHEGYDNITFTEGVVTPDSTIGGFWSGSVFPAETATNKPNVIRVYGTWTGIHAASGGDISLKYFSLVSINDEGKISYLSDYFDLAGLIPQAAAEE
jgi:ketosteroid isomerase-like protein